MIIILCALSEERDALLKHMKDYKIERYRDLLYHDHHLDNECYVGKINNKDVVVSRCGVGEVYATMTTTYLINKYKPKLIINLGCAGSLNENVHVNDVVIADKTAAWRYDIPEKKWERSFNNIFMTFKCDDNVINIIKKHHRSKHIHIGPIVSADEFIYKKSQVKEIKRYFPEALCGEMEGAAIATTCFAHDVPITIIRSISDETLVNNNFKQYDFNLLKVCDTAAELCKEVIGSLK